MLKIVKTKVSYVNVTYKVLSEKLTLLQLEKSNYQCFACLLVTAKSEPAARLLLQLIFSNVKKKT